MVDYEISRFSHMELLHMPGSKTTQGRPITCDFVTGCIAFRWDNVVGTLDYKPIAAQWLAYASLYRRFASTLTSSRARLEADVVRYTFTVMESHDLLPTDRPAHCPGLVDTGREIGERVRYAGATSSRSCKVL